MRYYGFANFMLSSIQQGIQNFHVCHDLFVKYENGPADVKEVLYDWAANHKTAVCLNGGNAAGIRDTYARIAELGTVLGLPYVSFREDYDSLDETMTACGIVVPTYIVDMASVVRTTPADWTEYDQKYPGPVHPAAVELALFLNQFGLAR